MLSATVFPVRIILLQEGNKWKKIKRANRSGDWFPDYTLKDLVSSKRAIGTVNVEGY